MSAPALPYSESDPECLENTISFLPLRAVGVTAPPSLVPTVGAAANEVSAVGAQTTGPPFFFSRRTRHYDSQYTCVLIVTRVHRSQRDAAFTCQDRCVDAQRDPGLDPHVFQQVSDKIYLFSNMFPSPGTSGVSAQGYFKGWISLESLRDGSPSDSTGERGLV